MNAQSEKHEVLNMDVDVDVQYASKEADLPDKDILTQWVKCALFSIPLIHKEVTSVLDSSQKKLPFLPYLFRSQKDNDNEEGNVEMTIRIVDEVEARQLNERWRQRAYPTNVLSFPFECPPGLDIPLLGDIVICAPLVASEAVEQHKPQQAHWVHLVIHGTLHLLGYDHISESQAQVMESLETRILHDLGYPNPYHNIEPL